jgi:hypothetical protein
MLGWEQGKAYANEKMWMKARVGKVWFLGGPQVSVWIGGGEFVDAGQGYLELAAALDWLRC